jgi:hypothetical protein
VLKIYHDCDDGIMPGQRKVFKMIDTLLLWIMFVNQLKLRIPSQYITSGGVARRAFDV